jgi:hypothetical protein
MDLNSVVYSGVRQFCSFVPKTVALLLNKKEDLTPEAVSPVISNGAAGNVSPNLSPSSIPIPPEPDALKISGTEVNGPRQEERKSLKVRIPSMRREDDRRNFENGVLEPEKRPVVLTGTLKNGSRVEDQTEAPRKRYADGNIKQPVVSIGGLKLDKKAEDQVEEVPRKPVDPYVRFMIFIFKFPLACFSHLFFTKIVSCILHL